MSTLCTEKSNKAKLFFILNFHPENLGQKNKMLERKTGDTVLNGSNLSVH